MIGVFFVTLYVVISLMIITTIISTMVGVFLGMLSLLEWVVDSLIPVLGKGSDE